MLSLVYLSIESYPYTESDLANLLSVSRANNRRLDLTGVLLYRRGQIMQLLEGPEEVVRTKYAVIERDPRHTQVEKVSEQTIIEREFPSWSMGYPPVVDIPALHSPGLKQFLSYLRRSSRDEQDRDGGPVDSSVMNSSGEHPESDQR